MSETLLAVKAGRAFRREGTNFVDPTPTKGAIILSNGEDGLLHFAWKNRSNDQVEEDLILFPWDASFSKVSQCTSGRVYVLKFSSSNQRHFFWLQDASSDRDSEFADNINGLLQDPNHILVWNTAAEGSAQAEASSSAGPSTSQATTGFQPTPEQLENLRSIVASMTGRPATTSPPELLLTDILTPANLNPLFTSHPELIPALFPHLPPDMPMPPSPEVLQRIVNSPQFRAAVSNFDQALRTGLLGGLVRGLGLPEEAGTSITAFLRAIQEHAGRSQPEQPDDSMETD